MSCLFFCSFWLFTPFPGVLVGLFYYPFPGRRVVSPSRVGRCSSLFHPSHEKEVVGGWVAADPGPCMSLIHTLKRRDRPDKGASFR